ncbi:hypothetical protein Bca52824_017861 [Brassica carinata]|uniref:Uncharacterized protein n=1 Tax=Brassica carinata TaxID=52824 RepID=A0A8X8AVT9_BRACI|nr:hypothetical protein Bca52824_017861 [Brassica carinata]
MPGDVPRVNRQLAVSRSFRDKSLKHTSSVMANQEAIDIEKRFKDPLKAAKELIFEAPRRDSKDHISCKGDGRSFETTKKKKKRKKETK